MKFIKYTSIILALITVILAVIFDRIEIDLSAPWQQVIGNIHPLILHIPIGALIIVVLIEIARKFSWIQADDSLLYFLLLFTSIVASFSFLTGFALAMQGGFPTELLSDHLWSATGYVCLLTICAVLKGIMGNRKVSSIFYPTSILGACVCMGLTGHYGGLMTHGDPLAPFFVREEAALNIDKPTEELLVFNEVVHPILKAKCYSCHGNGKSKGDLKMDSFEDLVRGGKDAGKTLIPGDHLNSLLITSIMLPINDEKHMPPKKQEQLTEGEVNILKWWVESGAKRDITVAEAQPPSEVFTAMTELVPAEIRQQREIERLEKIAQQKKLAKQQRQELSKKIQDSVPEKLRPMLRFISTMDASIHFSSVSIQDQFTDSDFAALTEFTDYFTAVDLSHSSITSATVKALASCKNLRSLRLADTKIKTEDLAYLKTLPALESLSLHSTEIDSSALNHLGEISSLRHLYLWSTKVSASDLDAFRKKYPNIKVVF